MYFEFTYNSIILARILIESRSFAKEYKPPTGPKNKNYFRGSLNHLFPRPHQKTIIDTDIDIDIIIQSRMTRKETGRSSTLLSLSLFSG